MNTAVILICTCNRPHYLRELLLAIVPELSSEICCTVAVVVVDNGTAPVAEVVEEFRQKIPLQYVRLPKPGLVDARNCSLKHGLEHKPDFLVFIDDDEVPAPGWLTGLVVALTSSGADIAVGPVQPIFDRPPPPWAPAFFTKSGEAYCTSNLIIRSAVLPVDESQWFQSQFSLTGGEDGELLKRLGERGAVSTVASDALVREHIPDSRVRPAYIWRRSVRDGIVAAMMISFKSKGKFKLFLSTTPKAAAKMLYGANHLLWSLHDHNRFVRALDDIGFATGLILGTFRFSVNFYGTE